MMQQALAPAMQQTIVLWQAIFVPGDVIHRRPIEIYEEGGHRKSQVKHAGIRYDRLGDVTLTTESLANWEARAAAENANAFFGVCPRFDAKGFDKAWQIREVRCLWSDVDNCTSLSELDQRLNAARLPYPSAIVLSGGGFHSYWRLVEDIHIDDADSPPRIQGQKFEIDGKPRYIDFFDQDGERVYLKDARTGKTNPANVPELSAKAQHAQDVLQGIAARIGGDPAAQDLSRLLRMPGSMNRKNIRHGQAPRLCELVNLSGERFPFSDFERFAKESPNAQRREKVRRVSLPAVRPLSIKRRDILSEKIAACDAAEVGNRSEADFALCCWGVEVGVSPDELWSQVESVGKFGERGREYFDRTWQKAQGHTQEKVFVKAEKKQASKTKRPSVSPSANTSHAIEPGRSTDASPQSHAEVAEKTVGQLLSDEFPLDFKENQTDITNARRLVFLNRGEIRFCHPWKSWLVWDGKRWRIDDIGDIVRRAKGVSDELWRDARSSDSDTAFQFAAKSAASRSINAMISLAESEPGVPVLPKELDSDPWFLNCENGTLDLRTGQIRDHNPADGITKLCPTAFNPEAPSYSWDRFLESVFEGKGDVIDFFQRYLGYSLTGLTIEQTLTILWGKGSNGKSTLLEAFIATLGTDYAMQAERDFLMAKRGDEHPTAMADLFGKRFVAATETEEGRRLAESFVKTLTGGDRIRARRMREDFWEFQPTHKLVLATNHKPKVKGGDHAIWRRIALIPFNVKFWNPAHGETGEAELKQDKSLPMRLDAEREGILAWAVRGCLDWQKRGLDIPATIREATKNYQSESDVLGRFLKECCRLGSADAMRTKFSDLYRKLEGFCEDEGVDLPSKRMVGLWMEEQPGIVKKMSNGRWYLGVEIAPSFD